METIWLLKDEDKTCGHINIHLFANYKSACAHLAQIADVIISDNDWLEDETEREEYERLGDFSLEENTFYLAYIAHITVEEYVVNQ